MIGGGLGGGGALQQGGAWACLATAHQRLQPGDEGGDADAGKFNKQVHYLFLGCGTEEQFGTRKLAESLRKIGIHVDYYESQGTAHEWLTWRRCLYRFVPHLFKNRK